MSPNPLPSCSVVIPVYNSELTLEMLVERLSQVLPDITSNYEVILVNDCSPDRSWEIICKLSQQFPWIRGINLMRNYGQHNALLCGIRAARNEITITMDDDLQHPPEEIHKLIEKLHEGYDVVYGSPQKLPHSLWRNFFSWYPKGAGLRDGHQNVRELSAFRAFRTHLRNAFQDYQSPGSSSTPCFPGAPRALPASRSTKNPAHWAVELRVFQTGQPGALDSHRLQHRSPAGGKLAGLYFMIVGMVVFLYVVLAYFTLGSIPGFPSWPPSFPCSAGRNCLLWAYSASTWRAFSTAAWTAPPTSSVKPSRTG